MSDPICKACQGRGYIIIYLGLGTVDIEQPSTGVRETLRGRFRGQKKCDACDGTGRIIKEEK
jgi:hypothetical protein